MEVPEGAGGALAFSPPSPLSPLTPPPPQSQGPCLTAQVSPWPLLRWVGRGRLSKAGPWTWERAFFPLSSGQHVGTVAPWMGNEDPSP